MATYENRLIGKTLRSFSRDTRILDVGCGYGQKLRHLRDLGFSNLQGVETNDTLIQSCRSDGFNVVSADEFLQQKTEKSYDLILMSHIIEHFQFDDLKHFLEHYLAHLNEHGYLLIVTPVFQNAFFDDFDHVKPYSHVGIGMVFGDDSAQVQFYSQYRLNLTDIRFVRLAYQLKFYRALILHTKWYRIPRTINRLLHLIYRLSFRLIGKPVAWIGLFEKTTKSRISSADDARE